MTASLRVADHHDSDVVVLDFDLVEAILKREEIILAQFEHSLADKRFRVDLVTVGQMWEWAQNDQTVPRPHRRVEQALRAFGGLERSQAVAVVWGQLRADSANGELSDIDLWVAAPCILREFPVATVQPAKYGSLPRNHRLRVIAPGDEQG